MKKNLACKKFLFDVILIVLFPIILNTVIFGIGLPLVLAANDDPNFFVKDFTDPVKLSTSDSVYPHHVETTMAITDDDRIYVGWKNSETHSGGGARNSFTVSSDDGATWADPVFMPMFNADNSRSSDPWMISYENTLYYCYLEFATAYPYWSMITVAKAIDYGNSWDTVQASYGKYFADKQTIAVDENENLYMVYDDIDQSEVNPSYVRVTRSLDAGATYEEVSVIAETENYTVSHLAPYVAIDSNNDVHVVWLWFTSDVWGDVYHVKSTDQGEHFTGYTDINPTSENGTWVGNSFQSAMKITLPVIQFDDNDRMYILYSEKNDDDGSWGTFIRYSDDYGTTFSDRFRIHTLATGEQWQPDMTIDAEGRLHFIYTEEIDGEYKTYYQTGYFVNDDFHLGTAIPLTAFYTSSSYWRPGEYNTIRLTSDGIPHIVFCANQGNGMDIFYVQGLTASDLSPTNLSLAIAIPSVVVIAIVVSSVIIVRKKKV
ncbi:MAG: sialidase family protein [Candidatus Heimdallarchaeota archaeon]